MATVVEGAFEWDSEKAAANVANHGVSFPQALVALTDVLDPSRIITVGFEPVSGLLVVVSTDVSDRTRIISAWKAEPADRRAYIKNQKV
jgi:uncharacterized DUF497 family protein